MDRRSGVLLPGLALYVLPLLLVTALLVRVGLTGLALALLAIEGVVVALTAYAKRAPVRAQGAQRPPSRRPWLVPLAMTGLLGGMVGIAVLASHAG